jgi:hypothetical protein
LGNDGAFLEKSEIDMNIALSKIPNGNKLQAFVEFTT